jgi:hypothetical protein
MRDCLNEKTLLLLYDGEGSPEDREHVDSCLNCARRYRQLGDDLKHIVSALKQAPPRKLAVAAAPRRWVRWSMAAAAVGLAFLVGRVTTARMYAGSELYAQQQQGRHVAALDQEYTARDETATTYGLYVDTLILLPDETEQEQTIADESWESESEGF